MDYINTIITNYIPIPNTGTENTSDFIKELMKALYSDENRKIIEREDFVSNLIFNCTKFTERQLIAIFSYISIETVLKQLLELEGHADLKFVTVL
jgi:hypothetical protein